ncbi:MULTISPECIES: TetR/AcrR family transcriptional regulator [Atopobiaceae]|uniref:TetR/AcrR family transcriptional regulator n=1 Tax=Atopobiaceae TaxID=1643824 RepID=UPI00034EB13D|nr:MULTISPECIES: TetR/AcrR family transcriptional regulator [Atopobiaceae]EPD77828.1 hypothetical protein HMPREF1527_00126 [Atopobium sp. oral taxon 199 str. F0494]
MIERDAHPLEEAGAHIVAAHAQAHELVHDAVVAVTHKRAENRTKKSIETRRRIMSEATKIMTERGNTDFKMSEVSSRAQLSKGALYYYFADRDALVQAIFDSSVDDLTEAVAQVSVGVSASVDSLRAIMCELASHIMPGSPLVLALINKFAGSERDLIPTMDSHLSRVIVLLAAQLERGKSEKFIREDADTRLAACAITGSLVLSAIGLMGHHGHEMTVDELVDHLLAMILNGIGIDSKLSA